MIDLRRIKDIREDNDITQDEMAHILKVNRSTYSLWELGINVIPLRYLIEFSNYFCVNIDYVVGLSKNRKYIPLEFNLVNIGSNLKMVRLSNNLSQENVANVLGVKQACIVRYEKGIICISTLNLYKFCAEFNIGFSNICTKKHH